MLDFVINKRNGGDSEGVHVKRKGVGEKERERKKAFFMFMRLGKRGGDMTLR